MLSIESFRESIEFNYIPFSTWIKKDDNSLKNFVYSYSSISSSKSIEINILILEIKDYSI